MGEEGDAAAAFLDNGTAGLDKVSRRLLAGMIHDVHITPIPESGLQAATAAACDVLLVRPIPGTDLFALTHHARVDQQLEVALDWPCRNTKSSPIGLGPASGRRSAPRIVVVIHQLVFVLCFPDFLSMECSHGARRFGATCHPSVPPVPDSILTVLSTEFESAAWFGTVPHRKPRCFQSPHKWA
ncbi:hypothetical protein VTO42DRAFT_8207 [Malbranchea cinnamomea]